MSIATISPASALRTKGASSGAAPRPAGRSGRDVGFAIGIVAILSIFFLPIPSFMIDMGLAFSIALSVLILMVALWIERPLDFSAFPTVLLVATLLRLALNIASRALQSLLVLIVMRRPRAFSIWQAMVRIQISS